MKIQDKLVKLLRSYPEKINRANEIDNNLFKTFENCRELEQLDKELEILNEELDNIMYDKYYPIVEYELIQNYDPTDVLLMLDCTGDEYVENRDRLIQLLINKLQDLLV